MGDCDEPVHRSHLKQTSRHEGGIFCLELCLQVSDEDNLCEECIVERHISPARNKEVVEEEVYGVEPFEERGLRYFVEPDDEVRNHAPDNAPGERRHAVYVAGVGEEKDKEKCHNPVDHHVGDGAFLVLFVDAVVIGQAGIAVRNHVDEKVRDKPKDKGENGVSAGFSDNGAKGCVGRKRHSNAGRIAERGCFWKG